jgi:hypothetical protein
MRCTFVAALESDRVRQGEFETNGNLIVTVSIKNGLPNATYDIWLEQNPGTCPPGTSTPSNPGALTTNRHGNGNAHFTMPVIPGATNFRLTARSPAGPPYPRPARHRQPEGLPLAERPKRIGWGLCQDGSTRRTVATRSRSRSNDAIAPTPLASALATR